MERIKDTIIVRWQKTRVDEETRQKTDYILSAIILIVVAAIFFTYNYYTPLYADDYTYSFSFASGERIDIFLDIFPSVYSHYFSTNGRTYTHLLAQLFLLMGKPVFNVINTGAFLLLGILIYWHSGFNSKKQNPTWLLIVFALLYILPPAFGQSFLWVTGASNYLYGILTVLIYLIPYRRYIKDGHEASNNLVFLVCMAISNFFFGIVAGGTNENNSIALICMVLLVIICTRKICKKKIPFWMLTGFAGNILGAFFMLTSPGTSQRLDSFGGFGGLYIWVLRGIHITFDALHYLFPAVILLAILISRYITLMPHKRGEGAFIPMIIFALGTLASIYSMVVSPAFPDRAWSGPVVLFIILVGCFASEIDEWLCTGKCNINRGSMTIIVSAVVICTLGSCAHTYFEIENVYNQYTERVDSILSQISAGEEVIRIESITSNSKYSCFDYITDLSENPDEWPNTSMAQYYGVDTVEKILQ